MSKVVEASTLLWKIIKLKCFLTFYSDLLSKVHLQSNLYYKKLDKMLKPNKYTIKIYKKR